MPSSTGRTGWRWGDSTPGSAYLRGGKSPALYCLSGSPQRVADRAGTIDREAVEVGVGRAVLTVSGEHPEERAVAACFHERVRPRGIDPRAILGVLVAELPDHERLPEATAVLHMPPDPADTPLRR